MKRAILNKFIFLTIGALLAGASLEFFLVPNQIIDGGIVGISIMSSYLLNIPLGLFLFVLNLPFLYLAFKRFGKNFLLTTFYSVSVLSIAVTVFHHYKSATDDLLLACVFGGIILGVGVGLILRNNGSLDGTEIIAITCAKKTGFSVGEIIMFFNLFILGAAGFILGWDRAMYSLITYFVAFRTIDLVLEGLDESKAVLVISDKPKEIGDAIIKRLDRSVTYIDAQGGYTGKDKKMVYCVITRLEVAKIKQIVKEIDCNYFMTIENIHEVEGGRFKKPNCER